MTACWAFAGVVGLSGLVLGCDGQREQITDPNLEEESLAPERALASVAVTASTVTVGFKHGRIRHDVALDAFRISKFPTTVDQYESCVAAGVCKERSEACLQRVHPPTEGESDVSGEAAQDAALCTSIASAGAFCQWHGGELPSLAQWFLAARGPRPQRYAWGDGSASCGSAESAPAPAQEVLGGRSPIGVSAPDPTGLAGRLTGAPAPVVTRSMPDVLLTSCRSETVGRFEVGQDEPTASPFGLQDVLLTGSELLRRDVHSYIQACRGKDGVCQIYGAQPRTIDFARHVSDGPERDTAKPSVEGVAMSRGDEVPEFGFRCVWSGEVGQ